jgi:signal transduction histidine kinase
MKTIMKKILRNVVKQHVYDSIPYDELLLKQKFALYRIFTFTAFLVALIMAIQIYSSDNNVVLPLLLVVLAVVIITNFFLTNNYRRLPIAFTVSLIAAYLMIHFQGYDTGGVKNTGTMYFCVLIMCAFMLLGPKAGKWYTFFAIVSVAVLYYATEFTNLTSYGLFHNDIHLINQDALTTFILALFLVAAQSSYLNSGKNVIIERITEQKNQLEISNYKLKEYTTHLEKTNRELDKFASIVSHDLKAPLRAIGNITDFIEEDAGTTFNAETRANFNTIKQRVKRMEDLIQAILDYSKADRKEGAEVKVDTKKLIEESIDFIGRPEKTKFTVEKNMPVVQTDQTRLSQVFTNLIGNAIKYNNNPQPEVIISVKEEDKYWLFSVKDNGPGIDKKFHEKIFVIFQTLNRRDDVESTGVGLAIVKKIVEDQGGNIWVESEPGKGADFKFLWPKVKKQKDAALKAA